MDLKGTGASTKAIGLMMVGFLAVVMLFAGIMTDWSFSMKPSAPAYTPPATPTTTTPEGVVCESSVTPSLTITLVDVHNPGTTITTPALMTREVGETSWTTRTAGTAFDANPLQEIEIVVGLNTTDNLQNTGSGVSGKKIIKYTVPCKEFPKLEIDAARYARSASVTVVSFDPEDGNSITSSDPVDIDIADNAMNIKIDLTGEYERNYGSVDCPGMSNTFVVRYNTTQYDKMIMQYNGADLSTACDRPNVLSSSTGYTDDGFCGPVVKSADNLGDAGLRLIVDADDNINPDGGMSNITLYYYDSAKYLNEDTNEVLCGVEDEDYTDIGSSSVVSHTIVVSDD